MKARKILLAAVNAKYIHSNPAVYSLREYAKKALKEGKKGAECEIEIAEFTINQKADEILRAIYKKQPQVLAFSCYIWNMRMIEELLCELPKILPDTEIWLGGPEVSYDAPRFLAEHLCVSLVMTGEGEETFAQLCMGGNPADICGIVFRSGEGQVAVNPPRALLDMDKLPFLYECLEDFENRIIYYESSRGCPFSCSYCLSSVDKSVRFRSTEKVKQELQFFLDNRTPQVKFVDRTFNCRKSHAMEIWRYIKEHDNGITNFHFEIAADLISREELKLLKTLRPGLVQMEIGVQSTNPQTLEEIERVSDFEHLSAVVRELQSGENIHLHLDLIAGLPFENYESFVKSFNDVYRLYPEQLQLGFLKVLKGSKMHQKAGQYGLCYHGQPVYEVLYSKWISYEEILKLKQVEEVLEIYYNSGQFSHTMRCLEEEFAHPFAMYEELAAYCAAEGAAQQKLSRMARFELLRSFIKSKTDNPLYDELLILDIYLRENSKSRPGWAEELNRWKPQMLEFYRRAENTQEFGTAYEGRSARQLMNMMHLEHFHFDVCGNHAAGEHWILFDYQKRNPLTYDAAFMDVTELI